ncbi:MAG TPA: enolase C-terminal domain-like protein [Burkholderiales bacterium]|nr:enolase C-terminal domain-like protein [Burkholderiales bacterium]
MKFSVLALDLFEREVHLRMPFRFGIVTLREAPQAFVRARVRLENGAEAEGGAAELLAPKWFDKNPTLSNEQNFDQLRKALSLAAAAYLAGGTNSAYGHFRAHYGEQIAAGARLGLNRLTACFGPALVDRALLDALCRALGISFYDAIRGNLPAIDVPTTFLNALQPAARIAARHTVGLTDPITAAEARPKVDDGLPESLEEVLERYGHRWFKLKIGGEVRHDVKRLRSIAAVLDRIPEPYFATLDGNEQYEHVSAVLDLWHTLKTEPRLSRLVSSIIFIEQPIKRQNALAADIAPLAAERPVIIDESDDTLEAFARARALGYTGVSSKSCKGLYKSLLNAARCHEWNREEGRERYFLSGEDLTMQAGLAVQQDLALVSILGLSHVERNGHHYVNGMAALPQDEQARFLAAHPDLYERSHGAVRLRIVRGELSIASLDCPGFASGALPDWDTMKEMKTQ